MEIKVELPPMSDENLDELIRSLYFISQEIIEIYKVENKLTIVHNLAEHDKLKNRIESHIESFLTGIRKEEVIYNFSNRRDYFQESMNSNLVINNKKNGLVTLQGVAIDLLNIFDEVFRGFALELFGDERIYPTVLPREAFEKTNYLKTSPQYSTFVSYPKEDLDCLESLHFLMNKSNVKENLNPPEFVLSPSACFHTFLDLENSELDNNKILTFQQNVFRNEGRNSWDNISRLRDYHVREIVFLGDFDFVKNTRENILNKAIDFLEDLNLDGKLCVASDSFVVPDMQRFKVVQKKERVKYEIKLNISENSNTSVASFNLHGTTFTDSFNINVDNVTATVSGCVGFGLERWVIAFLSQYGQNPDNWPEEIKKRITENKIPNYLLD